MEDKLYKEIEAYLGSDMSSEEVLNFEKRIQEDKNLKDEVALYNKLNHHLGNQWLNDDIPSNVYTQKLENYLDSKESKKAWEQLNEAKEKFTNTKGKTLNKKLWIAASIALLLSIGSMIFIKNKEPNLIAMYDLYSQETELPSIVERSETKSKPYEIISMFEDGQYQKTVDKFIDYEKGEEPIDTVLIIYKGMSYLELGKIDDALASFKIVSDSQLLDRSKGLWFTVLVHLKNNDKKMVVKTLKVILLDQSNYKYKEAEELYQELK